MFGNTFGRLFRITCSGESYSGGFRKNPNIPQELYGGLITIVDGVPAGIKITSELVQAELDKRKPGQTPLDSPQSITTVPLCRKQGREHFWQNG